LPKQSTQRRKRFEALLVGVGNTVDALPSESEKKEATEALDRLIAFLNDLKAQFDLLPSTEDTASMRVAVQKLQQVMSKVENDPALSNLFGPPLRRPGTRARTGGGEEGSPAAKRLLESWQGMPLEEIRTKLQTDVYPLTALRTAASALGVRPIKGLSREAIAHQIFMRIANSRGYQHLRGDVAVQEGTTGPGGQKRE